MTAPLSFLDLSRDAVKADRAPIEVAYLAHLLLDETIVARYTRPHLSPPATLLADLIDEMPALARVASLEGLVDGMLGLWPDIADATEQLAVRVDRVTVAELANVGPFSHVAAALGMRVRAKHKPKRSIERHVANAEQSAA